MHETQKQTEAVNALLRKKFKVTKTIDAFDGINVMLARHYHFNTHLAQVGPDGSVNGGETVPTFLAHFHD